MLAKEQPASQQEEVRFSRTHVVLVLGVLIAVYAAASLRYRWFNDDTFITFRYARHVAEGHGLVWNILDAVPVEGSTSLGWIAFNAAAILIGLDPLSFSQIFGALWGAVGLILAYLAGRRVLQLSVGFSLIAPAMLCLGRQYILSSVSGMETRAATVMIFAATVLFIHEMTRERARGLSSGALFLAATFMRPETPLLHLGAAAGAIAVRPSRAALKVIAGSGLVHILGLGLLTLWRIHYFGQPLPNTFYAKVGALQLSRGLPYIWQFLVQNHAWIWGLPLLLAAPLLVRRQPLAIGVFAAQAVSWSIWLAVLGGGRWEFRFVDPILPVIAVWSAASLASLATAISLRTRRRQPLIGAVAAAVIASQVATIVLPFRPFGQVISAPQAHAAAISIRREGIVLSSYLRPEDRISTGWAGAIPYHTDAWHFDPWGINDPEIARRPFDVDATVFHQRHASWQDIVENRVMFCDVFNRFIHRTPYDEQVRRMVNPWIEDFTPVYSVELRDDAYWIFTSANSRRELRAWLRSRGLAIYSMRLLPSGMPRP